MGLVALRHVRSSQTRDGTLSPALAGGFLATGPLGKPEYVFDDDNSNDELTPLNSCHE